MTPRHISNWGGERLDELRLHLSRPDALLQLALLGLLAGLLSGAVIVGFRLLVEGAQDGLLPGAGPENYEGLPAWARFALPVAGGLLLAAMFRWASGGLHVLGVARVMERMAYHQGHLTLRGFLLQFAGAAIAIASGHSVGREGPHIYLGAAASSLLGQRLTLPNNSIRTLVACGTAAGIAASFNTPLAGVAFALEVVMMEYTVASFVPVILAAVSATALSVAAFGPEPAFSMPALPPPAVSEIPLVLLLGLGVGALAALYVHMLQAIAVRSRPVPIWWRTTLAGFVVGLCALAVPEVMGIGYDTVSAALLGQLGAGLLIVIVATKLLATTACVGLGVPGGLIGPALFLGACTGSLAGIVAAKLLPGHEAFIGFYALLGMGAMMGASLQAPLAALTAMMELTHNAGIVMPGMLAVVVAALTAGELFRKESIFIAMLRSSGLDYDANPVHQALRRAGVGSVMTKNFARLDTRVTRFEADALVESGTDWILLERDGELSQMMATVELAKYLNALDPGEDTLVDLLAIPAQRLQLGPIPLQATLHEAHDLLEQGDAEALYVSGHHRGQGERVYGVLTASMVESAYRY